MISSAYPTTALSGVRSSCESMTTNRVFASLARLVASIARSSVSASRRAAVTSRIAINHIASEGASSSGSMSGWRRTHSMSR